MAYYDSYLIDTASRVILELEATPALFHQEAVGGAQNGGTSPEARGPRGEFGSGQAYGSGEFLAWL